MKDKKDTMYSLVLISIGVALILIVGLPLALNILALGFGLFLINYGLQLRGEPSLFVIAQRFIDEIKTKFF